MKRSELLRFKARERDRRLPVPLRYNSPVGEIFAYWRAVARIRHRVLSTISVDDAQTALMRLLERKPNAVVQWRVLSWGPEAGSGAPAWARAIPIRAIDVVAVAGGWKRLAELVSKALRREDRLIDPSWETQELQAEWARETWATAETIDDYEEWWNEDTKHGDDTQGWFCWKASWCGYRDKCRALFQENRRLWRLWRRGWIKEHGKAEAEQCPWPDGFCQDDGRLQDGKHDWELWKRIWFGRGK